MRSSGKLSWENWESTGGRRVFGLGDRTDVLKLVGNVGDGGRSGRGVPVGPGLVEASLVEEISGVCSGRVGDLAAAAVSGKDFNDVGARG